VLPEDGKVPFLNVLTGIGQETAKLRPAEKAIPENALRIGEQGLRQIAWSKDKTSLVTQILGRLAAALDKDVRKKWQGTKTRIKDA